MLHVSSSVTVIDESLRTVCLPNPCIDITTYDNVIWSICSLPNGLHTIQLLPRLIPALLCVIEWCCIKSRVDL